MGQAPLRTNENDTRTQLFEQLMQDPDFAPLQGDIEEMVKRESLTARFLDSAINRNLHKAVMLSGPPGLGKSHAAMQCLQDAGKVEKRDYVIIKGYITPLQLFTLLYLFREAGKVVVLDDCDRIFKDAISLNILKAATDPTFNTVTYSSSKSLVINGEVVSEFKFEASLIICTNITHGTNGGQVAQHFAAIASRMIEWPMALHTKEKRFAQVLNLMVNKDYLGADAKTALDDQQKTDLLKFIHKHLDDIPALDLRLPPKIAAQMNHDPENWQQTAEVFMRVGD